MLIFFFALFALLMLFFFCFGLVLFFDLRGIGSHYSARNRAVVEELADRGRNWQWYLIFGKRRKIGAFLMVLCGIPLLIALVGFVEVLAGVS